MSKRWSILLVVVLALISMAAMPALADDWDSQPTPDPDGSIALAERLALSAQAILHSQKMMPAVWQQSATMFRAACRLDPNEPRFARLLVDEEVQINDVPAAIAALGAYRNIMEQKLKQPDETAQTQQIELILSQMQSADEKIDYCRLLLKRDAIPANVRSFVAVCCAQLLRARSQTPQALAMLDTALTLNHINIAALAMKYDLTQYDALPLERVGELLALIRANPSDPDVVTRLAEQLANLGMVTDSVRWFNIAMGLYQHSEVRPDTQFARNAAAELVLADHADDAGRLLSEYLPVVPNDVDAWFLALTIAKANADQAVNNNAQDLYTTLLHQAGIALSNNFTEIRSAMGVPLATTRPIDSPGDITLPDLSGDVALLHKTDKPELAVAYATAASSLAWYDLYYRGDTASADPILKTLGDLLGEQDQGLIRLRGWRDLVGGDTDAASAKFATLHNDDPYVALGIIKIDQKVASRHDQMLVLARKLVADHPSGPTGVVLWEAVHGLGVSITPAQSSVAIGTALSVFPFDFLQILDKPETFYSLHVEPVQSSFAFGQPILLRVSVQNLNNYDLTIGRDGIIHRDLWFDAYLRGDYDQSIPGATVERLDQRLVLGVGQSISLIVRADSGPLNEICSHYPQATLDINMTMCSNPILVRPDPKGPVMANYGPAGYRVSLIRMLERTSIAMNSPAGCAKVINQLKDPDGGKKIRTMEAITAFISMVQNDPKATPDSKAMADDLISRIRKMRDDSSPIVSAAAMYLNCAVSPDANRNAVLNDMTTSKFWQVRMMALLAASNLPDHGAATAATLSNDTDATVSALAKDMAKVLISSPSTQPSPAAQP